MTKNTSNKVWEGSPSQLLNIYAFVSYPAMVFSLIYFEPYITNLVSLPLSSKVRIAVYVFAALFLLKLAWKMVQVHTHRFYLYQDHLLEAKGVFSRKEESLEMFRVKDISILKPILLRIFGLGSIRLITSDHTNPVVMLLAIKNVGELSSTIRNIVSAQRKVHGVREFD